MSSGTSHVESQAGVGEATLHEEALRRDGVLLTTQAIQEHEGSWPASPVRRHTAAKSSPRRPEVLDVADTQEASAEQLLALGRGSDDVRELGSQRLAPEVSGPLAVKRQRTAESAQYSQESQVLKLEYNHDARAIAKYLMDGSEEDRRRADQERQRAEDERERPWHAIPGGLPVPENKGEAPFM